MKATIITRRTDKAGKHNDRNFNIGEAPHIDQDRVKDNLYWTYNGDLYHAFDEVELEFYNQHFSKQLEKLNEKHRKSRQKKRIKNMDQFRRCRIFRPEDQILQVGDRNEHLTGEELWSIVLEYQNTLDNLYGENCRILDMALHLDEETPHVHARRVWIAHDDNGDEIVCQYKALDEMGFCAPDRTIDENTRNNNSKMSFTQFDQALFRKICRDRGYQIEEYIHLTLQK